MAMWTPIILALITTVGTVVTAIFASKAKGSATAASGSATAASDHADAAKEASLRPPPDRPTPPTVA